MSAPNIITTGYNAEGLSVFINSPEYKVYSPHIGMVYSSSDNEPLNLNDNVDISTFESGDLSTDHSTLIPKQGHTILNVEWPPSMDSRNRMHRTLTVDVGVILSGQLECHLDSGESRLLKQGDILLQRGTKHAWVNPSSTESVRMLCFVLPSKPVEGAKD